jgi:hypothetical protein
MNTQPNASEFEGIRYYRGGADSTAVFFMPAAPAAERDSQGRPSLMLISSDQGGILQLGTRWEAPSDALERLRQHLAGEMNVPPAAIRLQPLPIEVQSVTLAAGDGEGNFSELQQSRSSGYGALTAIFNVTLDAARKASAIAALNGRAGFLTVTYRATVSLPGAQGAIPVTAATDIGDWFPTGAGQEHVLMTGATI